MAAFRLSSRKEIEEKLDIKKDPYNALHYTLSQPIDPKQF